MAKIRERGTWQQQFWQAVEDVGYLIEGESRSYERERVKALGRGLAEMLAEHPETQLRNGEPWPLEYFAMHAVARLANALTFNDDCGANQPDFKQNLIKGVREIVGSRDLFFDETEDELNKIFGELPREENQK